MSSRKYGWTEEKIARFEKEGRGQGELSNYKPWLTIQDVPSKGRSHRVMGWKTNRIHHLFSDLEFDYLCILDWVPNVIDIREQYPLDRISTLKISEVLEIKHPYDSKTGTPIVMTTDFLITLREGNKLIHLARTIKPSEQLNDERIIQKFEIERIYWEKQGVNWGIVTEKELLPIVISNLKYLRNSYSIDLDLEIRSFLYEWNTYSGEILKNLKSFDRKYNYEHGTGITIFRHLLARKILITDINIPIDLHGNIKNIRLDSNQISEEGLA